MSPTGVGTSKAPGCWLLSLCDSPASSLIPQPVLPGGPVSSLSPRDSQLPLCFYSGAKPWSLCFTEVIEGGSCLSASHGGPSSHAGLWARKLPSGFSLSGFLSPNGTHSPHGQISEPCCCHPAPSRSSWTTLCKTHSNSLKA